SELFRNPVLLSRKCFAFSQEPIFITAGQSVICITAAVSVGSHYRALDALSKDKLDLLVQARVFTSIRVIIRRLLPFIPAVAVIAPDFHG
ncbi:MAG: hypothetical protein ACRC8W_03440, partial [Plesiomonas shigelloides]